MLACVPLVLGGSPFRGCAAGAGVGERDHRAAKATAGDARSEDAGLRGQDLDQAVHHFRRDLEVVPQAAVGLVEQLAETGQIAPLERPDGRLDARVFGDHVAHAPGIRLR